MLSIWLLTATMRHRFMLAGTAVIKTWASAGQKEDKSESSYVAGRIQNGKGNVEHSLEIPPNVKHRIPIGPSNYSPRFKHKRNVTNVYMRTCTQRAVLVTTTKKSTDSNTQQQLKG